MSASLRFFRQILRTALGAAAASACLLAVACGRDADGPRVAPEPARPALWRIADADTTIYLFGTIHMLPTGAEWRTTAVDQALAGATTTYFEADVQGDAGEQRAVVQRLGLLSSTERLSRKLDPALASDLTAAAARVGYAMSTLETQKPWFAAVTLADAAIRAASYSANEGVETVLRREAEAAGKEIRFFETMEQQLSTLANLPEPVQVKYLAYTVSDMDSVKVALAGMVNAWRTGDTATLSRLLIDDDMARLPELQDALLTRRNGAWAETLKALLEAEPGQFFVAVGAAHMVGDDSVLNQLTRMDVASERIQ